MFEAAESPYLVTDDGKFRVKNADSASPKGSPGKKNVRSNLQKGLMRFPICSESSMPMTGTPSF